MSEEKLALLGTQTFTAPFGTILADPPWRFNNRTGKNAPEHQRLMRYPTMALEEIQELPIAQVACLQAHLYLWVPNALLAEGLAVMHAWGFTYKTHLVWVKVRRDGGPDGSGCGFSFRNVTELCLFGIRGSLRTLAPGRRQVNVLAAHKREHSHKPDELYTIIEQCSPGPYLELFARYRRAKWVQWGNQLGSVADVLIPDSRKRVISHKNGSSGVSLLCSAVQTPLFEEMEQAE